MHKITSLELLRTPIRVLLQLSNYENARTQMLKNVFLNEKKLLNAILRAKLKYMKMFLSNEINSFLQCRRQILSFELFAEKVILELKCTKSLLRASKKTNSVF